MWPFPKQQRNKWEKVAWQRKLVGYGNSTHFYRFYNPKAQMVETCKDVKIIESKVPLPGPQRCILFDEDTLTIVQEDVKEEKVKRGRGPKGSKNKPKESLAPHPIDTRSEGVKTQEKTPENEEGSNEL
jgi:hypothetical protein